MTILATILVLALTRAEIIARMKAPVITQCEGLVQVYADCPEDMRREYQMPVASFAAETVKTLYRGLGIRPRRYRTAAIKIHVGDVRTNLTTVVTRVTTNGSEIVNRIYLKSPGSADIGRFRLELVKAFSRTVRGEPVDDAGAAALYRKSDPAFRTADERRRLDDWLAGRLPSPTDADDEANLALMRRVLEPGVASRTDLRIFASRLFLYPSVRDRPFCGRFDCLSFREAVACAARDPSVRFAAGRKAGPLVAFGLGRGDRMNEAVRGYCDFLLALARGEEDEAALLDLLEQADVKLNLAWEKAGQRD